MLRIGITADMIAVGAGEIFQFVNRLIHITLPKTYIFPYFIIFSEKNQLNDQKNGKKKENNRLKVKQCYAIIKSQIKALV